MLIFPIRQGPQAVMPAGPMQPGEPPPVPGPYPDPEPDPFPPPGPMEPGLPTYEDVPPIQPIDG